MDPELLAAGVDLTHDLDRAFGLRPKITMSQARMQTSVWWNAWSMQWFRQHPSWRSKHNMRHRTRAAHIVHF